jgi:hypothetical protein
MLLVSAPWSRAADSISSKPTSRSPRTELLILRPSNLRFGNVAVGQRKVQTVTITNSGNSSITLSQVITQGKGFALLGLNLPLTLAGGESFTFCGIFAPQFRGDTRGSISFVADVSDVTNPRLELSGIGSDDGQLTVDPKTIDFGAVPVGSSASQPAKLIAPDGPVTISSAYSSSSEFTFDGLSFPFTIPAGGSQGYTVTFTPQADGAVFATLSFLGDSGNSPVIQFLTGTGTVQRTPPRVDLSWNASTSQDVIGYNVYRASTSGGPYSKINSVLDSSTVYTDISVVSGNTYYYVTTAVDSNNQESIYSNEAQATVPGS